MRRYGLRDDQWDRIKDHLPGREGYVGGTAPRRRERPRCCSATEGDEVAPLHESSRLRATPYHASWL
jgi:hypothetical protein